MVIKIGITGNIASGKTTVEEILKKLGVKTFCADSFCHYLMEEDPTVKNKTEAVFRSIQEDTVNKDKIREIIFNNKEKREELEKILHPLVFKEIKSFFLRNKKERVAAAIVPLLFETKSEKMFDKVVLICADEKTRTKRIKKRNRLEDDLIEKIIKSQIPQEKKLKKADFVIENNNKSKGELEKEIKTILEKIK